MLYRRQWLTCAFQSVISTGINIHVQEPDWSFYTNWSSPSLQPARVLGHHGRLWNQQHSEYPIINFYYEHVPLYPHGQVIIRTGVELLSPRGGPEGQFFKHDGQSKENKPKEQGCEHLWSLNFLSSAISRGEAAMFVLRVLDNFCYALNWSIGLRALFKYACTLINIVGLSKKKKKLCHRQNKTQHSEQ